MDMGCPNPRRSSAVAACVPDDALVEVFSRLPFKSLHRSKCVCKRWRDIIANPLYRKILPQTLVGFFSTIHPDDGTRSFHEFVDLLGTSASVAPPPALDPCFPFLDELPAAAGIKCSLRVISDSCNGLLLFEYGQQEHPESMGYVVFNPATEQRVVVPGIWTAGATSCLSAKAYLLFDPSASSHFHILLFWEEDVSLVTVHAYSSETRAWSHSERDWSPEDQHRPTEAWRRHHCAFKDIFASRGGVFVNGALYVYTRIENDDYVILELDVEGKTRSIIPMPSEVVRSEDHPRRRVLFFGQSQGQLYCISHGYAGCDLSISVIEDPGTTKQWVLKHTVSCVWLFGRKCFRARLELSSFAIHPDSSTLFILDSYTQKLISYDVDSNRVRYLKTLDGPYVWLIPYVPCFMDLLSN